MALEYAQLSQLLHTGPQDFDGTLFLGMAVMMAAGDLDPDALGSARLIFSSVAEDPVGLGDPQAASSVSPGHIPRYTPDDVARQIALTRLAPVTPEFLRTAVERAINGARYWQQPEGEDFLTQVPAVLEQLERVAKHVLSSSHTLWWTAPADLNDQWQREWMRQEEPGPIGFPPARKPVAQALLDWQRETLECEEQSRLELERDPATASSGQWWSSPPWDAFSSARSYPDQVPCHLWWVEDSAGIDKCKAQRLEIDPRVKIFEVHGPGDWAYLCQHYGVEITAQNYNVWFGTTGRRGRWVIPDWFKVSQDFDGVHLSVAGYLTTAGLTVTVDQERSSLIAGWDPDVTYWLTDLVKVGSDQVIWDLKDTGSDTVWVKAE